jgi:DNA-binding NarL/FixJ family response regulator
MNEIRVFLAIDHPLVLQGLAAACNAQPDLRVVGDARDAQTLMNALPSIAPDVVVHHARLPLSEGARTIRALYGPRQPWRCILLVPLSEREPLHRKYRRRVDAMLLANDLPQHVIRTIRQVRHGGSFVCPLLAATLGYRHDGKLPPTVATLDETEQRVFLLLNEFHTGSAVARELGLTVSEVSDYRLRLCEALHAHAPGDRSEEDGPAGKGPAPGKVSLPAIRWDTSPSTSSSADSMS